MGVYINPLNETKESFLRREGERIDPPQRQYEILFFLEYGQTIVCLIDNTIFTAALVCRFGTSDFADCLDSRDNRPKTWYKVPTDKLTSDVIPDAKELFKRYPEIPPAPSSHRK